MRGLVTLGMCACLLVAAPDAGTRSSESAPSPTCPRSVSPLPLTLDQAVDAARAKAVRGKTISHGGQTYKLNNANTPVIAAVRLDPTTGSQHLVQVGRLRRIATALCGARTATSAWAIIMFYTQAQMATNQVGYTFVVRANGQPHTF